MSELIGSLLELLSLVQHESSRLARAHIHVQENYRLRGRFIRSFLRFQIRSTELPLLVLFILRPQFQTKSHSPLPLPFKILFRLLPTLMGFSHSLRSTINSSYFYLLLETFLFKVRNQLRLKSALQIFSKLRQLSFFLSLHLFQRGFRPLLLA